MLREVLPLLAVLDFPGNTQWPVTGALLSKAHGIGCSADLSVSLHPCCPLVLQWPTMTAC